MLYSNREYSLTTKSIDVETMSLAYSFLTDGEKITHTFDAGDIIALFTTKKIIFVYIEKNKFYETELLPYQSISRSSVIGTPNANHGKLELYISDEIILTFYMPIYSDAVKLCRMITEQM